MAKIANKFLVKKYEAEALDTLASKLQDLINDNSRSYEVVGKEEEQARDWRTNELQWEDEEQTIPRYRDKYDYVDIDPAEFDEGRLARLTAYNNLIKKLEGLL